jgi:hypothetical protein
MSAPPGHAGHGKHGGEETPIQPERVEEDGRVKLDVGEQRPIRVSGPKNAHGRALDGARKGKTLRRQAGRLEADKRILEDLGARVAYSVDAVSHAHDAPPSGNLAFEPCSGAVGSADRVEHVEHGPRGSSVEGSMAATTAEIVSDAVDATTRAVNVDAFIP